MNSSTSHSEAGSPPAPGCELRKLGGFFARLFATVIVLELALRAWHGELLATDNLILKKLDLFRSAYPGQYDATLGWAPIPGAIKRMSVWGTILTILGDGTRSNGPAEDSDTEILAVGDSYTFGDGVSDDGTWPAALSRALHSNVVNGGVYAYGMDQIALRAEQLMERHHPQFLIVSFLPQSIERCEYADEANMPKPYFILEGGELAIRNQPVPFSPPAQMDPIRALFGRSHLANYVMARAEPRWWFQGGQERRRISKEGVATAIRLVERLARRASSDTVTLVFLAQYDGDLRFGEISKPVVDRARGLRLATVDLLVDLERIRSEDPGRFNNLYNRVNAHMTREGNAYTAEKLAEVISGLGAVARKSSVTAEHPAHGSGPSKGLH